MKKFALLFISIFILSFVGRATAQDGTTCNMTSGKDCHGDFNAAEECNIYDLYSWNCDKCQKPAPFGYCPKPVNQHGGEIAVLYPFSPADMQSFIDDAETHHTRALAHLEACIAHRRLEQESYGIINPVAGR